MLPKSWNNSERHLLQWKHDGNCYSDASTGEHIEPLVGEWQREYSWGYNWCGGSFGATARRVEGRTGNASYAARFGRRRCSVVIVHWTGKNKRDTETNGLLGCIWITLEYRVLGNDNGLACM